MVKDSVMLRADTGDVGLESSMLPLQEMEHEGKKYTAGSPELANLAGVYDKAEEVIAKEDEARLERVDKFDYLQLAGGGLTRTVAPDSGPVSRGLSYLYNRVKRKQEKIKGIFKIPKAISIAKKGCGKASNIEKIKQRFGKFEKPSKVWDSKEKKWVYSSKEKK